MLAIKYLFLFATFLYCLGGALSVTCDEDPTDTACIDCTTDPDNTECVTTTTTTTTSTTTTTTTVAPATTAGPTAASTEAPTAAPQTTKKAGNVKKVTIKNLKYKVTRKIKVTNKSG